VSRTKKKRAHASALFIAMLCKKADPLLTDSQIDTALRKVLDPHPSARQAQRAAEKAAAEREEVTEFLSKYASPQSQKRWAAVSGKSSGAESSKKKRGSSAPDS
jgi:hypothetical protein